MSGQIPSFDSDVPNIIELWNLVDRASRGDRLYPLRSNNYRGFYTGQIKSGEQAFLGFIGEELTVHAFDLEGNFRCLDQLTVGLASLAEQKLRRANETELLEYLSIKIGFSPSPIRIKRYDSRQGGGRFSIDPVPPHFVEFLKSPDAYSASERSRIPQTIRKWVAREDFVLNFNNNYYVDANGEVTSS